MRYETKADLSAILRETLPDRAQDLYLKAYHDAWDGYEEEKGGDLDREAYAHLRGMGAVEMEYNKVSNVWYPKGEEPENGEEKQEGLLDKIKDMF